MKLEDEVEILKGLIESLEETYSYVDCPTWEIEEDTEYIAGKELLESKQRELYKEINSKETFDFEYILKTIEEHKTKN